MGSGRLRHHRRRAEIANLPPEHRPFELLGHVPFLQDPASDLAEIGAFAGPSQFESAFERWVGDPWPHLSRKSRGAPRRRDFGHKPNAWIKRAVAALTGRATSPVYSFGQGLQRSRGAAERLCRHCDRHHPAGRIHRPGGRVAATVRTAGVDGLRRTAPEMIVQARRFAEGSERGAGAWFPSALHPANGQTPLAKGLGRGGATRVRVLRSVWWKASARPGMVSTVSSK